MNPHLTLTLSPPIRLRQGYGGQVGWERRGKSNRLSRVDGWRSGIVRRGLFGIRGLDGVSPYRPGGGQRTARPTIWCLIGWVALAAAGGVRAADTNAPVATNAPPVTNAAPAAAPALTPEQMFEGGTNAKVNWVDFTAGEAIVSGNRAHFQQQHQIPAGGFGGVSDFHFQTGIATNTTLTLDGHALAEEHDYKLALGIEKEKVGFLRLSYEQSRTWYNGDGGFFPGSGQYYAAGDNPLALDRGKLTLEGGWLPETGPKVTFKYTHSFREGAEGSTEWGYAHETGIPYAQGLSPTLEQIHEHSDSFQLDVNDRIKATDVGVGLRYERGGLDDALKITEYPGEPVQEKITDRQGTTYDLLNFHGFTETWVKTNVMVSTGFSYSGVGNEMSASRIYGNDFDVGYAPMAASGFGYYGLTGTSRQHDYVFDLNLFYKPAPHWSIVPSLRVDREDWSGASSGMETFELNSPAPFTADSSRGLIDVRERLDVNYNGLTNWAFYGRGDFTESDGNLNQDGGLVPVAGIGFPGVQEQTDDRRFFQKYSAGARWYPSRAATLDVGGYYKLNQYHYGIGLDSTTNSPGSANEYPNFLAMQDFETYDANVRLTLRPWQNVTAISRYEYQTFHHPHRTGPGERAVRGGILADDEPYYCGGCELDPVEPAVVAGGIELRVERHAHAGVGRDAGDPDGAKQLLDIQFYVGAGAG